MFEKSWDERIKEAEERGIFIREDQVFARELTFCSLGEAFYHKTGQRYDYDMGVADEIDPDCLNVKFCRAVLNDEITKAKRSHNKIKKLVEKADLSRYMGSEIE